MKTISTLIFLISFNLAFCQTDGKTCATAHEIPEEEISCINKVVEENQIWLKFKATQTFINLSITNDYNLDAIELFSGDCSSLTSIVKTGRRHIEYSHLNLNEFYYFSITGANQELSLITKNINTTTFPNCTFTDVSGCVKVQNGFFTDLDSVNIADGAVDVNCFNYNTQQVPGWMGQSGEVALLDEDGPVARLTVESGS